MSETKCVRILLRKPTFCGNASLLFSVEESHKHRRKAVSLSFFYILDKDMRCFGYAQHGKILVVLSNKTPRQFLIVLIQLYPIIFFLTNKKTAPAEKFRQKQFKNHSFFFSKCIMFGAREPKTTITAPMACKADILSL